ncbi:hypothetical protein K2X33_04560 [bacterium]|nr:hypothetical protein [bacterium]
MKYILTLVIALMASVGAYAFDIDTGIASFGSELESKIQNNIARFFGQDAKILVTVHLEGKKDKPSASESEPLDLAYLPTPLSESRYSNASDRHKKLSLISTRVTLRVASDIPDRIVKTAEEIVRDTLNGYSPKIKVIRVSLDTEAPAANTPAEKKSYKPLIYQGLIALGTALTILLGFLLFGAAIRKAAQTLSEGLRTLGPSEGRGTRDAQRDTPRETVREQTIREQAAAGSIAMPPPLPPSHSAITPSERVSIKHNLSIFTKALQDKPLVIAKSFGTSAVELQGMRWLLPQLDQTNRDLLKRILSAEQIEALRESARTNFGTPGEIASAQWLQSLVEKIVLANMQDEDNIEDIIGPEASTQLANSDNSQLTLAAKKIGTHAAWRVIAEFLSPEQIARIQSQDETSWNDLLLAWKADTEELKGAASAIVASFGQSAENTEANRQMTYFRTFIVPPMVEAISKMSVEEQERFLEKTRAKSPDLAACISEFVWTPSMLQKIPQVKLRECLLELEPEKRPILIWALPSSEAKLIYSFLKEGNIKQIATEYLTKEKPTTSTPQWQEAQAVATRFLRIVRVRAEKDGFVPDMKVERAA